FPEAIEHLQFALQLRPDFVDGQMNLGNLLFLQKRYLEAVAHFTQALRQNPELAAAAFGLARSEAALHHANQALAAAPTALQTARSHGRTELAEQIEAWLANYRAQ